MIYTELTRLAMKIAYKAHDGQVDRAGVPYIFHPLHLAEQMTTEDTCVVALLHDVVEDTDMTIDDLRVYGFTERQLRAVDLLTRKPDAPDATEEERLNNYYEYVRKAGEDEIARVVKIADLRHNSDRSRVVNSDNDYVRTFDNHDENRDNNHHDENGDQASDNSRASEKKFTFDEKRYEKYRKALTILGVNFD